VVVVVEAVVVVVVWFDATNVVITDKLPLDGIGPLMAVPGIDAPVASSEDVNDATEPAVMPLSVVATNNSDVDVPAAGCELLTSFCGSSEATTLC